MEIVIFDDGLLSARTSQDCVARYAASIGLPCALSIYTSEEELMQRAAGRTPVDLLFADIDLGEKKKNGIQVVQTFLKLQPQCQVVFLTNYLNFATEVYETPHLYFVLKSELEQRLPAVFRRAVQPRKRQILRLCKRSGDVMVEADEIIYCEHHGRKTDIVTTGETISVYQKISDLLETLDERDFVSCHSSYIVHFRYVVKFTRTEFTMIDGKIIPVSRSTYTKTKKKFADYLARSAEGGLE